MKNIPNVIIFDPAPGEVFALDPTKVIFRLKGIYGLELSDILQYEKNVTLEKHTETACVATITAGV